MCNSLGSKKGPLEIGFHDNIPRFLSQFIGRAYLFVASIIDEDVQTLKMRVDQISDPNLTHAENPPTLTQRLVSNVEAYYGERNGVFEATSSILLYANRSGAPETGLYAGERQDVLIRDSNGFKIAKRTVNLAQTVLHDSTLSLLL